LDEAKDPEIIRVPEEKIRQAMAPWKTEKTAVQLAKQTGMRERLHEDRRNGQCHPQTMSISIVYGSTWHG
jgi:hypothetical protein